MRSRLIIVTVALLAAFVPQSRAATDSSADIYLGRLRVYVVEPISRWDNAGGVPYHYAAIEIPLSQGLWLDKNEVETYVVEWDGNPWYSDIQPDNIMMIAAVFNNDSYIRYSQPPDENPFSVHNADAAAAATPTQPGMNEARDGFTHTVFTEEVTGST
jgi:hypothetical protein